MEGSQSQPPFGCCNDRGILETLVVPPRDDSVIDDLFDVNDGSLIYGDFHLPEFPCMSSSSSSSTTPAPANPAGYSPTSSSASLVGASVLSSPATSWAMLNHDADAVEGMENRLLVPVGSGGANGQSEALASTASMEIILEKPSEEDAAAAATVGISSTVSPVAMSVVDECMDVMENFGYMELLEGGDMFDPTSIFQSDNLLDLEVQHTGCFGQDHEDQNYHHELICQPHEKENEAVLVTDTRCDDVPAVEVEDDMGAMFLEWLRANRDSISVEDLRKVKIKKSTIEMAARRLGGGKEAMKQLLKLILEWVQTNHFPRKYAVESSSSYTDFDQQFIQSNSNPNFAPTQLASAMFADPSTSDSCFVSRWATPPPLFPHPGMDPSSAAVGAYMGGEPMDFQMVDSSQSWPPAVQWPSYEYTENFQPTLGSPRGFGGGFGYPSRYPLQYFGAGSSHMKFTRVGSSATKEARKKRMARQRQLHSHHHHYHRVGNSHRQDAGQHNVAVEQTPGMMMSENYCTDTGQLDGDANWKYWSPAMQGGMAAGEQLQVQPTEVVPTVHPPPPPPPPPQSFQRPVPSQQPDMRQGWKPESNLKFLLQKVLKQSDVGNLGRIVLPKKEAETHLPELEARDGISIAMEDMVTSRVWNMRYRFWPNNKSRMYLLENTGDFVRTNGLEEGDFIVIYSDVKCGKYLIRGVKVRQPEGATKAETKRNEKAQIRSNNNNAGRATIVHGTGK